MLTFRWNHPVYIPIALYIQCSIIYNLNKTLTHTRNTELPVNLLAAHKLSGTPYDMIHQLLVEKASAHSAVQTMEPISIFDKKKKTTTTQKWDKFSNIAANSHTNINVARKALRNANGASCAVPGCSLLHSTRTTFIRKIIDANNDIKTGTLSIHMLGLSSIQQLCVKSEENLCEKLV